MSKRRFNWPYLDFRLRIPFVAIETHVMTERFDMNTREYIGLRVEVWKWNTQFRLYSPRGSPV